MKFCLTPTLVLRRLALVTVFALAACGVDPHSPEATILADSPPPYDYPIQNPYAATVIATPPEQKVDFSAVPEPEEQELEIFPDREIPEGFWYEDGLHYSQLLQDHAAPLVYVIAGTGADHRAEKMRALGNMLWTAGFHVVLLPSPTSQNFIVNASSNYLIGRPRQSAFDMYRVIQRIDPLIAEQVGVTQRMLTGFSLGAMDAAFTAQRDDEEHKINFSRVLLINPPYSLNSSIHRIDQMLYIGLPGGIDNADGFIEKIMRRLASTGGVDPLNFQNERLLLDAYEQYKIDDSSLASTIGLSFRLSAANMIFANDVMSHGGYVFPANKEFTTGTDLNRILPVALRTSFIDYFDEYYTAQARKAAPGITREEMVYESSLAALDGYIRNNSKFGLISNQDDVILAPGEIDKLAAMFGPRAHIFNNGGHLGNMAHPTVAYYIVRFLRDGGQS